MGLIVSVEAQRVLDACQCQAVCNRTSEIAHKPVGDRRVRAADGGQVENLPVDQLDTMRIGENAGLGQPVVGVDVEPMSGWPERTFENFGHGSSPSVKLQLAAPRANPQPSLASSASSSV